MSEPTSLGPWSTTSTLRDPVQLQQLCDLCGVPKEYKPILAGPRVACTAPPEGSICVYTDALRTGSMRLPLHKFYMAVLQHYGLAPSQLVPNAWRYVAAFILLCKDAGVEPQLPVFKNFFYVRAHKGYSLGWHSFRAYAASGSVPLFTGQFRDRDHGWKARFFFLQAPSTAQVRTQVQAQVQSQTQEMFSYFQAQFAAIGHPLPTPPMWAPRPPISSPPMPGSAGSNAGVGVGAGDVDLSAARNLFPQAPPPFDP